MSNYTEDTANELADLALADEALTGDMKIVQTIADMMGATSQSLEEAYLTAIRVRRAERRAREVLATRAAGRSKSSEPVADSAEPPSEGS